jgi:UDP-N-acetylmuramoyl-tripeptide--D-alanyl-D-alanine ligase
MKEKLHIIDQFNGKSILFLNGDDKLLAGLQGKLNAKIIYFGTQPWCDVRAEKIITNKDSISFTFVAPNVSQQVKLPVLGMHNVLNALAGLAVAQKLGVSITKAIDKLSNYKTLAMRQQIHYINEMVVIDDSYNASPDAIRSSVEVLCSFHTGKRIAVLADMLELGDFSPKAHFQVGVHAAQTGVDVVMTVGKRAIKIAEGALSVSPDMVCYLCENNEEAISKLKSILTGGDAVLIKGSRAMQTDQIVKALL